MNTEELNTDELFKALPSFINVDGKLYHFSMIKGSKRVLIDYRMNASEGGHPLCNAYWGGKTLKDALKNCLDWLIEHEYYDQPKRNILQDMINSVIEKRNQDEENV